MEKETITDRKTPSTLPTVAEEQGVEDSGQPSKVRTASPDQFRKAQAKTSAQHAGLFRRLAK